MVVSKNNSRVMITLSKDLRESLEQQASVENRSLSNYIVTILQKHVKAGESK